MRVLLIGRGGGGHAGPGEIKTGEFDVSGQVNVVVGYGHNSGETQFGSLLSAARAQRGNRGPDKKAAHLDFSMFKYADVKPCTDEDGGLLIDGYAYHGGYFAYGAGSGYAAGQAGVVYVEWDDTIVDPASLVRPHHIRAPTADPFAGLPVGLSSLSSFVD